jgi:branched-chain amino acid transport system ATP-binding protein
MILELKNLSHKFSASKEILSDISLKLERGKIYALMGANGSGKTTLFNIITGFITPRTGSILFQLIEIRGLLPYRINH